MEWDSRRGFATPTAAAAACSEKFSVNLTYLGAPPWGAEVGQAVTGSQGLAKGSRGATAKSQAEVRVCCSTGRPAIVNGTLIRRYA